jgi:hypothetical protein
VARDACSSNTVVIPPSSGDCSSALESITEAVKVSGSFYCMTDQLDSSQGTRCVLLFFLWSLRLFSITVAIEMLVYHYSFI